MMMFGRPPVTDAKEERENAARMKRLADKKVIAEKQAKAEAEEADGVVSLPTVVWRGTYGRANTVQVIEFAGIEKCKGAPVLEGVPGSGLTSLLTASYFTKKMQLPVVGVIRIPSSPPQGLVLRNEASSCTGVFQSIRICGDERLVTIQSEQPVNKGGLAANLSRALLDFCSRHRSKMLITVEGVPSKPDDMEDCERLRFVTTSEAFSKHMKEGNNLAVINGIISGFTGQLLADAAVFVPGEDGSNETKKAREAREDKATSTEEADDAKAKASSASDSDASDSDDCGKLLGLTAILAKIDARLPSAKSAVHVVHALNKFLGRMAKEAGIDIDSQPAAALEAAKAARAKVAGKDKDAAEEKNTPKEDDALVVVTDLEDSSFELEMAIKEAMKSAKPAGRRAAPPTGMYQ